VIPEVLVLDKLVDCIDAESIDAAVEPEAQHVQHGRPDLGVPPVEIGLLLEKCVIVILAGWFIEGPGRSTKLAHPVAGWRAVGPWITPDIPIAFRMHS